MRFLVTGMPRSGTSLTAHLLSRATSLSLSDDPKEAMAATVHQGCVRWVRTLLTHLDGFAVVKAPRLTEVIGELLRLDAALIAVHLVRDPRDVYCSVLEKVRTGNPTSMTDNERFHPLSGSLEDGVAAAAAYYHERQVEVRESMPTRNIVLRYEHILRDPERDTASCRQVARRTDSRSDAC